MMATATAVPATADVDGLQQPYDRFEVAQFMQEASQSANMADSPTAPSSTSVHSTPAPPADAVEALSRPPSTSTDVAARSEPATVAPAPAAKASAQRPLRPAHNGFAVLNLNRPSGPRPGTLGPNRDGRVKNPVPRKLKGKTSELNGEFGVMHMDMSGQGGRVGRSSAAQITSESTAQAARNAQKGGYVSLKKRRIDAEADHLQRQALESNRYMPILPVREYTPRAGPLTPAQTKLEQARLLTLLRSINPITVVDQICKAVAFFGGIPGAPAPADGFFPPSAEANGKGELFIGWLSEIFPDLGGRRTWKPEETNAHAPGKRGRGRPKGSKASKVRKDKGIKKGPLRKSGTLDEEGGVIGDDEWVDVVDVASDDDDDDDEGSDVAEGSAAKQKPARARRPPSVNPDTRTLEAIHDAIDNNREVPNSTATSSQDQIASTSTPKNKGGRPKGSKNKPKYPPGTIIPETQRSEGSSSTMLTPQSFHQALQQATANIAAGFPAVNSTPRAEPSRAQGTPGTAEGTTPKNKGGRPRGSKNKPKDAAMQAHMTTPLFTGAAIANMLPHVDGGSPLKRRPGRPRKESVNAAGPAGSPAVAGLSAEERAVLEAYRAVRASQTPAAAPTTPATGEKRKRGRPRRSEPQQATADTEETTEPTNAVPTAAPPSTRQIESPAVIAALPSEIPQAPDSTKPPPAKRQRRPKDATASPAKRKQPQDQRSVEQPSPSLPTPAPAPVPAPAPAPASASAPVQATATMSQTSQSPAMQPTAISPTFPSSVATSHTMSQQHPNSMRTPSQSQQTNTTHTLSQMSMPPARPRPSGLEAHYEQFAAAAKQQSQPPQQPQNPSHRDPNENQNLMSRLGMQTSGQTTPSYFAQAHRSGTSAMGYGQGYGAQQQYHTSQNSPQLDGFRSQSNGNITPQQQKTFSPQAQNHGGNNHYGSFNSPDLFDMSSLETRNGSIGSASYSGISRPTAPNRVPNTGNPYGATANRISDGFNNGLSEEELRERIMRLGRR